jgi:hypothetical protein
MINVHDQLEFGTRRRRTECGVRRAIFRDLRRGPDRRLALPLWPSARSPSLLRHGNAGIL